MTIRIIVVDDHSKVHMAIVALMDIYDDLQLVGHGNNGEDALQLCAEHNPDIVIMDVIMPKMNGIEATRLIHAQYPNIKVLALSSFQDSESVRGMLSAGAVGYILKTTSIEDLANTLRTVQAGKAIFSPEVTQALITPEPPKPLPETEDYHLTTREKEILRLMIEGKSNGEIAAILVISISTAKFHVSSVINKLGVTNRVEAVALALEKRLI